MGSEAENVCSLFLGQQGDILICLAQEGHVSTRGRRIKIDNLEFVYYVINATLYS